MPTEPDLDYQEAVRLMEAEQWKEALEMLKLLCADDPGDYAAQWNCGWCLLKLGRPHEAVASLEEATKLQPSRPEAHWALGVALAQMGNPQDAEKSLRMSLAMKDTYLVRLALARTLHEEGRVAEAEEVYREGIRARPDHRERVEALADFLTDVGRKEEALALYERARSMLPRDARRKRKL